MTDAKIASMPLSRLVWIDPAELRANDYNPNHVAPPEMRLLKLSIIEDGWTQPIVARPDGEIVDGFHRWSLGSKDPDVRALTGGKVPVVYLDESLSPAQQRMATIRHNRARGSHSVVRMADIVTDLLDEHGLEIDEVERRLGMEFEEVDRLHDRGAMPKRGGQDGFGQAWAPAEKGDADAGE